MNNQNIDAAGVAAQLAELVNDVVEAVEGYKAQGIHQPGPIATPEAVCYVESANWFTIGHSDGSIWRVEVKRTDVFQTHSSESGCEYCPDPHAPNRTGDPEVDRPYNRWYAGNPESTTGPGADLPKTWTCGRCGIDVFVGEPSNFIEVNGETRPVCNFCVGRGPKDQLPAVKKVTTDARRNVDNDPGSLWVLDHDPVFGVTETNDDAEHPEDLDEEGNYVPPATHEEWVRRQKRDGVEGDADTCTDDCD